MRFLKSILLFAGSAVAWVCFVILLCLISSAVFGGDIEKSAVAVAVPMRDGGVALGSGVIVDPELVLTNFHVVERRRVGSAVFVSVTDPVKTILPGHVIVEDCKADLAAIAVHPPFKLTPATLSRGILCPGDRVTIAVGRRDPVDLYETEVAGLDEAGVTVKGHGAPGTSGSGYFNAAGELVAIHRASEYFAAEGYAATTQNIRHAIGDAHEAVNDQEVVCNGKSCFILPSQPRSSYPPGTLGQVCPSCGRVHAAPFQPGPPRPTAPSWQPLNGAPSVPRPAPMPAGAPKRNGNGVDSGLPVYGDKGAPLPAPPPKPLPTTRPIADRPPVIDEGTPVENPSVSAKLESMRTWLLEQLKVKADVRDLAGLAADLKGLSEANPALKAELLGRIEELAKDSGQSKDEIINNFTDIKVAIEALRDARTTVVPAIANSAAAGEPLWKAALRIAGLTAAGGAAGITGVGLPIALWRGLQAVFAGLSLARALKKKIDSRGDNSVTVSTQTGSTTSVERQVPLEVPIPQPQLTMLEYVKLAKESKEAAARREALAKFAHANPDSDAPRRIEEMFKIILAGK